MHIRDDRVYRYCDALYPLIRQADVYVGEMDLTDLPHRAAEQGYNMAAFFRPAVYSKLRKQILKSFKLDINRYAHLHPLMIMSAISQTILDNDHAVSLDEHLWNYAKENHLTLQGLETINEQMEILHSIKPDSLYRQIREISSHPRKMRKFSDSAIDCYTRGDIHQLYQLTKSSMHELRKLIIYDRNRLMTTRILSFDPAVHYFVTIGAGHLSGSTGIISGLRKSGYKVSPVRFLPLKGESETARHT
jgi:uncharacterized protein YbaP (TraB family)